MTDIEKVEEIVEEIKERRKRLNSIKHLKQLLSAPYEQRKFHWYDRLLWGKQTSRDQEKPVITREEAQLFSEWLRDVEEPRVRKIIADLEDSVTFLDKGQETR